MRVHKKELRKIIVATFITCDLCKKEIDSDNGEDCAFINYVFGMGTKYDQQKLELDICEKCLIALFEKYITKGI